MRHNLSLQRGFSLLEAIVALAIFSAVGVVVFGWINQSMNTVAAVDQRTIEAKIEEIAIAEISQENLFAYSSGKVTLPYDWQVTWKAEALTERQSNIHYNGEPGRYRIQLFEITAQIQPLDKNGAIREDVGPPGSFQFERLMVAE